MAFDGIVLAAVTTELQDLVGSRIMKIYQPDAHSLLLHLYNRQNKAKLYISTHPVNGRIHLTKLNYDNPLNPPLFCMLLRKHLEGGKIVAITQGENLERILTISVEVFDELEDRKLKQLIIEIMGKHSNLILVDPATGIIHDGIKRYSHEVSRYREVLPGKPYLPPPIQNKLDLLTIKEEQFKSALLAAPLNSFVYKLLVKNLGGISTPVAKELMLAAGLPLELTLASMGDYEFSLLWKQLVALSKQVSCRNFTPLVYRRVEELLDFSAVPYNFSLQAEKLFFPSMSQALDYYFEQKMLQEELAQEKRSLLKVLNKEAERNYKKKMLQEETVNFAKDAEPFRIMGELLTANIYRIKKGMEEITVENFYDQENKLITIPLEKELTPAQNAQAYFKKYNKAKASAEKALTQLQLTCEELDYLESVIQSVEQAEALTEIEEIKQELIKEGYLTSSASKKAKLKPAARSKPEFLRFTSSAGFPILVGKNNRQNDLLTLKIAKDHDLWFHVKGLPGSHVIVQTAGKEVPDSTIEEAALVAAYYSKGQSSSQVPVDWTLKKYVKKPSGAKPGKVIYEHYKTIYLTPDKHKLAKLEKVSNDNEG